MKWPTWRKTRHSPSTVKPAPPVVKKTADEFPFVQPTGWPEEDFGKVFRSQAITAAKSLYWSLMAPK